MNKIVKLLHLRLRNMSMYELDSKIVLRKVGRNSQYPTVSNYYATLSTYSKNIMLAKITR